MKQIHKMLCYDYTWQIAMDADIQSLDGWELVSYGGHLPTTEQVIVSSGSRSTGRIV